MTNLSPEQRRLLYLRNSEADFALEHFTSINSLSGHDNPVDVTKSQVEYLTTSFRIVHLRQRFYELHGKSTKNPISKWKLTDFKDLYVSKILVPSVALYHRYGSRGNASDVQLIRNDWLNDYASNIQNFNKVAQLQFDRCQTIILQDELCILLTTFFKSHVQWLYTSLQDEMSGRLFRLSNIVEVSSTISEPLIYSISENDYQAKMNLMSKFIHELKQAESAIMVDERKAVDDNNFICVKSGLNQAIYNLSVGLTKWQQLKINENQQHTNLLNAHLIKLLEQKESELNNLKNVLKNYHNNFERRVRMAGAENAGDIHVDLAISNSELHEIKKQRRVDEKKIRAEVVEEYSELVKELSLQVHVLKNRFNEYRQSLFHETMTIMSDAKKEELRLVVDGLDAPETAKKNAARMVEFEERYNDVSDDNNELKLTIMKMRSMYAIKDVALRNLYQRKIKKLSEFLKLAEDKLWDCYRDSDAREKIMKRQLNKTQKGFIFAETEIETLKKQVSEEHKIKTALTRSKIADDHKIKILSERIERLEKYDGIDVDLILTDLMEKEKRIKNYELEEKRRQGIERAKESRKKVLSRSAKSLLFAAATG
jgi:hypothetical protein